MLNQTKKLSTFLFMLCILISLAACSGNDGEKTGKKAETSGNSMETTGEYSQSVGESKSNEQSSTAVSGFTFDAGNNGGKVASLPDGYPSDIFPLYKDSHLESVVEFDGSYTLIAFSKDDNTKVAAFYKELLKDAKVTSESESDSAFTSFGKIGSYTYNFDTGVSTELEGYATSISIIMMPAK